VGERASSAADPTNATTPPRTRCAALRRTMEAHDGHGSTEARRSSARLATSVGHPRIGRGHPSVRQRRYHEAAMARRSPPARRQVTLDSRTDSSRGGW
jgi:hypothetical protein